MAIFWEFMLDFWECNQLLGTKDLMTLMVSKDFWVKLFDFEPQLNGDVLLRTTKYHYGR